MAISGGLREHRLTVVDDSPELLALFGDVLRLDGSKVALLDSDATLRDIEESVPDLVVIDLRLGTDSLAGLDIIRRLRSHHELRHVPIIVCSAATDALSELDGELSRIPGLSILPKPFSLDELQSCVEVALGERREVRT